MAQQRVEYIWYNIGATLRNNEVSGETIPEGYNVCELNEKVFQCFGTKLSLHGLVVWGGTSGLKPCVG